MVNSKHAFWQALVFTAVVFVLGLMLGFFLENSRASEIELNLIHSEINLLDEQLRNRVINELNVSCSLAVDSTFEFADRIYAEAVKLEKYDSASKFTDDLKIIHKRYDLLRVILWSDAARLRKNCGEDFHTVVYFFNYNSEDLNVKAEQATFSRLLVDLKDKYPGDILLIPIAGNLELESITLAKEFYDIESPAILIDDKRVIDEIVTFNELENTVFKQ